jgi:hypothetical protein
VRTPAHDHEEEARKNDEDDDERPDSDPGECPRRLLLMAAVLMNPSDESGHGGAEQHPDGEVLLAEEARET